MQPNYANLFSTQPLDRLEEIYQATMDVMDDTTLQAYCMTAKYNKSLCNDNFWLRRIKEHNLELLLPYRSLYPSLMLFYFNVRKDACYIVAAVGEGEEDAYAFNDINMARRAFTNLVNDEHGMGYDDDDEDIEPNYGELTSMYEIYVLFNNVVLTQQSILPYSIFNLRTDSTNYLNPSILNFPLLSHSHKALYYTKWNTEARSLTETRFLSEIAILPFDSEHLRLLPKDARMTYLTIDSVTTFELPYVWRKESFGIVTYGLDDEVFILVDTSLLSDSNRVMLGYVLRASSHVFHGLLDVNNDKEEEYRVITLTRKEYNIVVNLLSASKRAYDEGKSQEVLPVAVIIEALLISGTIEPLSKLQRLLDYNKR